MMIIVMARGRSLGILGPGDDCHDEYDDHRDDHDDHCDHYDDHWDDHDILSLQGEDLWAFWDQVMMIRMIRMKMMITPLFPCMGESLGHSGTR